MAAALRRLVSQNRRRFSEDGFDLDLTYILPNLIAMGFPAENYERMYRNNIVDVARFFELKHPGRYRIYNLCSERTYDANRFRHNVVVYPFDDHQPPCIDLISSCCEDISSWLARDPENIAAVHCKAGKGRTGLIVCAYLLHCGRVKTPDEALSFYGKARTVDSHGVTIPSQKRYIQYYAYLLQAGSPYRDIPLHLNCVRLLDNPSTNDLPCSGLIFSVVQFKEVIWSSSILPLSPTSTNYSVENAVSLQPPLVVCGDVLVECHGVQTAMLSLGALFPKKEKIFHFWFNTFFVGSNVDENHVEGDQISLSITRDRLDMVTKDRSWRNFPDTFRVDLWFDRPSKDVKDFRREQIPVL